MRSCNADYRQYLKSTLRMLKLANRRVWADGCGQEPEYTEAHTMLYRDRSVIDWDRLYLAMLMQSRDLCRL